MSVDQNHKENIKWISCKFALSVFFKFFIVLSHLFDFHTCLKVPWYIISKLPHL